MSTNQSVVATLVSFLLVVLSQPMAAQLSVSPSVASYSDAAGVIGLTMQTRLGVTPDQSVVLIGAPRDGLFVLSPALSSARRIGRKGSGPGEYRNIEGFGWLADTLWVSDNGTRRLTFVDRFGRGNVRTQIFTGIVTASSFTTQPMAITPDGTFICGTLPRSRNSDVMTASLEPLLRISSGTSRRPDTLLLMNVRNRTHEVRVRDAVLTGRQLASDATLWALSRNGLYAATVERSDEAAQRRQPPQLTVMHSDGRVIYQKYLQHSMQRATSADIDSLLARKVESFNNASRTHGIPRLTATEYGRSLFIPRYRIPVIDLVLGDDGTVLLRGNDWTGARVAYTWFDPNGTIRGNFAVPRAQLVRAVAGPYIWSLVEHPDGDVRLLKQAVD